MTAMAQIRHLKAIGAIDAFETASSYGHGCMRVVARNQFTFF